LRLRFFFPAQHSLSIRTGHRPASIRADESGIHAIKFTARGGILIGARLRGDKLLLQVWDTGWHTRVYLPRIFDEFLPGAQSATQPRGGLGSGPVHLQAPMSLLDGEIVCRSRPDMFGV